MMKYMLAAIVSAAFLAWTPALAVKPGCIPCESLCDKCSVKLRTGTSRNCRASCAAWAAKYGLSTLYVLPNMGMCGKDSWAGIARACYDKR